LREMADAAVSVLAELIGRGESQPAPAEGRRIVKSFVLQHGASATRLR
jgi:hypothetical protein